jgi:predicted alpha/beta hydrolase
MTFYSLPFAPERPEATEARLEAIYEAARYGLKGDSLALAAGLTPSQYRRLAEFDALVEIAEMKGRADGELSAAKTMYHAAANGDAKAALEILKHQHGWVAKQQIDVNVEGQISVIAALEKAERRVIEGLYTELPRIEDNNRAAANLLSGGRNGVDGEVVVDGYQG